MSSYVTIEELTGKKRRLDLCGTGVPFKGAPWGGENVLPTTFYPGNKRASQQVIAPKLTPSDWSGVWRTSHLLRSPCQWYETPGSTGTSIGYAHQLWEIVESLREEGQLLRVTWATQSPTPSPGAAVPQRSLKVVRIGRIGSFEPKPDTIDDIAWSISFVWIGKEETPVKLQPVTPDILASLQQCITASQAAAQLPTRVHTKIPTRFSLGDIEQMVGAPLAVVDSFARAATNAISVMRELGDLVIKVRDVPASLYGRALDVAINAVGTANNFMDQISREGKETLAARQKVSILTRTCSYYSGAITQAQLMASLNTDAKLRLSRRGTAARAAAGSGSRTEGRDLITVISPKQGDTMAAISQRYYGADLSGALAKANGLPPYRIAPPIGVPLIIPTRTVLELLTSRSS